MIEQNRVQWGYAAGSTEELAKRYDEWAKDRDSDLERDFAWNGHVRGVEAYVRYVDQGALAIDIGCGTGLAASELSKQGFHQLNAFDLSEGMLAEARKLRIYGDLRPCTLGQPLEYTTSAYAAAIATGVFSAGHTPAVAGTKWQES